MAVKTKHTFAAANGSTKTFSGHGIELNNLDDLDVYVTLSGGTRVLMSRSASDTTSTSSHPQYNDTTGLYFPPVAVGTQLYNYQLSTANDTITFNQNIPNQSVVTVERRTRDGSGQYTTFAGGSTLRHTDLNRANKESNFTAQEARNKAFTLEKTVRIFDVASPDSDRTITLPNTTGTVVTTGDTGTVTSAMIADGTIQAGDIATGALDGRYFTETESDARYFRQDSTETIASGDTWSGGDTKIATTGAIDARLLDVIEDVGGFVPVANETSFPAANPDVNNGAGTVVSVKAVSTTLSKGSGTVTITNGAGTGNTVTLTGVTENIPQGFGMILETTTTLHTYTFHRLTAPATEVHNVSTNVSNITSAVANATNINAAVANAANITAVADNKDNINTVAGQITLAEDLGSIANAVQTWTGNDINTVADSIDDVKRYAEEYKIAASAPSGATAGDLWYDTGANKLKVYSSNAWASVGQGDFIVNDSAKTTGSLVYYDGSEFKADATTTKSSLVIGGNF